MSVEVRTCEPILAVTLACSTLQANSGFAMSAHGGAVAARATLGSSARTRGTQWVAWWMCMGLCDLCMRSIFDAARLTLPITVHAQNASVPVANGTPAPAQAQGPGLSERPDADGYRLTRGLTAPCALLRAELAALLAAARWWEKSADWLQVRHCRDTMARHERGNALNLHP